MPNFEIVSNFLLLNASQSELFAYVIITLFVLRHGGSQGGPGVHVTPLYKPFCKQTTYNIQVTIW